MGLTRRPLLSSVLSAMANFTVRTRPSVLRWVSVTRASCHLLPERPSSPLVMTMSSIHIFRLGLLHFRLCCMMSKYSFVQRTQNAFARCCTRLQRILQYLPGDWNVRGGGRTTLVFMVEDGLALRGSRMVERSWYQLPVSYCCGLPLFRT